MKISFKLSAVLLLMGFTGCMQTTVKDLREEAMNRYIDELMAQMSVEEKLGQLNLPAANDITTGRARSSNTAEKIRQGLVGGLFNLKGAEQIREVQRMAVEESRLGIPLLFGMDVIHGYETIFPIPLAMSCTWDLNAIYTATRVAATEASADGICWTFSPMADISKDPRWGRVSEGNGEDPFLAGAITSTMVTAYQGEGIDALTRNDQIMACVKHFALYGASEAGRDYNTVDMSRQRMMNEYMYPYQAGIEAGAGSVMAAFNEVDGIPATGNAWLMDTLLRKKWHFDGFVVTDYTGLNEMVDHGIGDTLQAAVQAIRAGIDMDMVSEGFINELKQALRKGLIMESTIDKACRQVLEAKYKLGLFDDPYKYCNPERAKREIFTPEHRAIARSIAAQSFVLLKNDTINTSGKVAQPLLPLKKQGRIAIIGPLGNSRSNMPGTWSVAARLDAAPSLYEGMKELLNGKVEVRYAKGSNLMDDAQYEERATLFGRSLNRDNRTTEQLLQEALQVANSSDVIIAALGESSEMAGESSSRTELNIPDAQRRLLEALIHTGKPVVLVLFTGRPLTLEWEQANLPAILCAWFGGTETAHALTDVLFGDVCPGGKLTMTFPKKVGQIPLYYNHKNTGRPQKQGEWFEKFRSNYLDVDNEPLYPFGYGLSYTTFKISPVTLSSSTMNMNGAVEAQVTITNTGQRIGSEVIQLYVRDLVGSITRPVNELKGFCKINLLPGESQTVTFVITPELLHFYNYNLQHVVEPGDFQIGIGNNCMNLQTVTLQLTE